MEISKGSKSDVMHKREKEQNHGRLLPTLYSCEIVVKDGGGLHFVRHKMPSN